MPESILTAASPFPASGAFRSITARTLMDFIPDARSNSSLVYSKITAARTIDVTVWTCPEKVEGLSDSVRPMPRLYQMDLESWLDQTGYVYEGKPKTNNDRLRLIADCDDPVIEPEFELWNALIISGSPYRADILLRTASVTAVLIDRLLECAAQKHPSARSSKQNTIGFQRINPRRPGVASLPPAPACPQRGPSLL